MQNLVDVRLHAIALEDERTTTVGGKNQNPSLSIIHQYDERKSVK